MRRTASGFLEELDTLIAAARRRHPQWHVVIDAVRASAVAAADPRWTEAAVTARLAAQRSVDAPVLDGAEIRVPMEGEALRLAEAAMRHEESAPQAAFAIQPLLQACARVHAERIPTNWPEGYCPVCGAWPVLAELVGIDRARHLRCGRCASDWRITWLTCPYCGEHDHARLGRLVPEESSESRFLETCSTCGGYIKTLTTLLPSTPLELALKDLDSVELDVAALDHDFMRPAEPGHRLNVRLIGA
jgi:FdhE protein